MSFLTRLTRLFKRKIKATPSLLAATVVHLASDHTEFLQRTLAQFGKSTNSEQVLVCLAELARAYYCLASLHVCGRIPNSDLANLYGVGMLNFLRQYPDESLAIIRRLFADNGNLDQALRFYVHDTPNDRDLLALENARSLLRLSEANPVHFFAGKVHARTMQLLGITMHDPCYLGAWYATIAKIIGAMEVLTRTKPIFAE